MLPNSVFVLGRAQIWADKGVFANHFGGFCFITECLHLTSLRASQSVSAALCESLRVSICLIYYSVLYKSSIKVPSDRRTDGFIASYLVSSTLRNSCRCGKVNDRLPLATLPEARPLVCFFREKVKYSFNKLQCNTSEKETNGTFQLKPDAD